MKFLISSVILLLGINLCAFSQNSSLERKQFAIDNLCKNISKKTNTIYISIPETNKIAILKQVKLIIADQNILPDDIDTDLFLLNTQPFKKTRQEKLSIRIIEQNKEIKINVIGFF